MEVLSTTNESRCNSLHRTIKNILPDSPEDIERFAMHSEDLQPTSDLHSSTLQGPTARLVVVGDYEKQVILGRGGASTIKIGRRNRQISRTHVAIEFNAESQHFQLTILGLNGASVDHVGYNQHAIVVLEDHSFIDVVGDHIEFRIPPRPLNVKSKESSPVDLNAEIENTESLVEDIPATDLPLEEKAEETVKEADKETLVETVEEIQEQVKEEQKDEAVKKEQDEMIKEENKEPLDALEEVLKEDDDEELSVFEEELKEEEMLRRDDKLLETDEDDYSEVIIDALVFSRTSSMPVSDICSRIMKSNPAYGEQSRELWTERIKRVLKEKPFFGEIQRKGKTADGSPKENLYYYNSELDPVEWRRATYTQVGRSARKCTLKDKQYFWKIPPKLGRHRSSYIPPPANISETKNKRSRQIDQNENSDPKKTKL